MGDNSTNLQANRDIISNKGLSIQQAMEIAVELFKENFPKLQKIASNIAKEKADEIAMDVFLKLIEKDQTLLER